MCHSSKAIWLNVWDWISINFKQSFGTKIEGKQKFQEVPFQMILFSKSLRSFCETLDKLFFSAGTHSKKGSKANKKKIKSIQEIWLEKTIQPITRMSGARTRIWKWDQFSKCRWSSTKVITINNIYILAPFQQRAKSSREAANEGPAVLHALFHSLYTSSKWKHHPRYDNDILKYGRFTETVVDFQRQRA